MKATEKQQPKASQQLCHPAIGHLGPDVDLGGGMLIAETEDGHYEPIAEVATINEAKELARDDMASRMRRLEGGEEPACPAIYRVWSRNYGGRYAIACEMAAATLKPLNRTLTSQPTFSQYCPVSPNSAGFGLSQQ